MNSNNLSRQQKLDLLKNIAAGKVPASILKNARYLIKVGYPELGNTQFLIDGKSIERDEFHQKLI